MKTIKGLAHFLAQFAGDAAPLNCWDSIRKSAAEVGFKGVQVTSLVGRLIDLARAAENQDHCDEFVGVAAANGVEVTELSNLLQGQRVAVHPAIDEGFERFAAPGVRGKIKARQASVVDRVKKALAASNRMSNTAHGSFSGARAWPYLYPWPQRLAGLIETAFDELAKRWTPVLDYADEMGADIAYEIHPGEDLRDGVTFEMFAGRVRGHPRANMLHDLSHYALQCLDYLDNFDIFKGRIKMFHVKDAEFNPTGRQGVYSGFQPWADRAGRFRSLGDGQVEFRAIVSKMAAYDFDGSAAAGWECAPKHPEGGTRDGAAFVKDQIIRVTEKAVDGFAGGGADEAANRRMLGNGG